MRWCQTRIGKSKLSPNYTSGVGLANLARVWIFEWEKTPQNLLV